MAAVFTPKDYTIDDIMLRIVDEIRRAHGLAPVLGRPERCPRGPSTTGQWWTALATGQR